MSRRFGAPALLLCLVPMSCPSRAQALLRAPRYPPGSSSLGQPRREGEADISLAAQIRRLQNGSPREISAALEALQTAGRKARAAVPELVNLLNQRPEKDIQLAAIVALGRVGPGVSSVATRALLAKLAEGNDQKSQAVEEALAQIRPADTAAIAPLVEALSVPNPKHIARYERLRAAAAYTLIRFGPAAAPATEALAKWIREADASISPGPPIGEYASLLYHIGPPAAGAADAIVAQLQPGSPLTPSELQVESATPLLVALSRIGVPARVLPTLLRGLQQDSPALFAASARAAGNLGPVAASAIPLLTRGLSPDVSDIIMDRQLRGSCAFSPFSHDFSTSTQLETILALGKIGAAAAPARERLQQIADTVPQSPYEAERGIAAREALLRIGRALGALPSTSAQESIALPQEARVALNKAVPNFSVIDVQGGRHQLKEWHGHPVLMIFVDTRCPCVTAYEGRLRALANQSESRGLKLVYVFANPDDNQSDIRKFAGSYPWLATLDSGQQLTRLFDARVFTETFLLDGKSVLRYHGRIDDNIFDPESVKEPTLENAIRAVSENRLVKCPEARAIGCSIPRLQARHDDPPRKLQRVS